LGIPSFLYKLRVNLITDYNIANIFEYSKGILALLLPIVVFLKQIIQYI